MSFLSICDFLIKRSSFNYEDRLHLLSLNRQSHQSFFYQLLEFFDNEEKLLTLLADYFNVDFELIDKVTLDYHVSKYIPELYAKGHFILPLFVLGNELTVAICNPFYIDILEEVASYTSLNVNFVLTPKSNIESMFMYCYSLKDHKDEQTGKTGMQSLYDMGLNLIEERGSTQEEIYDLAQEEPIAQLVEAIIGQAVNEKVSDIHIEPEDDNLKIRFRIDGILKDIMSPPKQLESAIISRLKVLANMDITENRKSQDGRITFNVNDRDIDFRISTVRTVSGEKMVLRILDKSGAYVALEKLGLLDSDYHRLTSLVQSTSGVLIVCGPTGSGKTSTLYSALSKLNFSELNVVTVEDPVEFNLERVNQIQVNPKIGIDFLSALTSVLRQDPDVIMIGEVRDYETANIVIQAALTGHFVLTTLHTRSAAGTVTRLIDMGVQPFLLNSTVNGVLSQRLVRCICENCKEQVSVDFYTNGKEKLFLDYVKSKHDHFSLYHGTGCKYCDGFGYKGRTGIFEIMELTENVKEAIVEKNSSDKIQRVAIEDGMVLMRDDAMVKVLKGITTVEEIARILD